MELGEEEDDLLVPEDVLNEAQIATWSLIPEKSRAIYKKQYDLFKVWMNERNVKIVNEDVMLAYVSEMSKQFKPSTVWCRCSMIKKLLLVNEDIDIGKYVLLVYIYICSIVRY